MGLYSTIQFWMFDGALRQTPNVTEKKQSAQQSAAIAAMLPCAHESSALASSILS